MSDEELKKALMIVSRIGICDCGAGDGWMLIRDLLRRARDRMSGESKLSFYDPMHIHYREAPALIPAEAVEVLAKWLDSYQCGLLDHGTGIGGAFLTRDGELLLRFLDECGTNSNLWPELDEV